MATRKGKKAPAALPGQMSFVVAKEDVYRAINEEREAVLELLTASYRAKTEMKSAALEGALAALTAVLGRVEKLGLG